MSRLVWDQIGSRVYEAGVDRAVLYPPVGDGVPWNGLTSVQETSTDAKQTPYYVDGVRYFNDRSIGEYSGILKAYTYPIEFLPFDGYESPATGMYVDEQNVDSRFGLTYRTTVGNDLLGLSHGYKIHVLYNLAASPSSRSYETQSNSTNALEFSWDIAGSPESLTGFRPTTHVIFDSRTTPASGLLAIENALYGSATTSARLPAITELLTLRAQ